MRRTPPFILLSVLGTGLAVLPPISLAAAAPTATTSAQAPTAQSGTAQSGTAQSGVPRSGFAQGALQPVPPVLQQLPLAGVDLAAAAELGLTPTPGAPFVLTSRRSTTSFSALGISWARDTTPDNLRLRVRTVHDGTWSEWKELEIESNAQPQADTPEAENPARREGSDPIWVGPSEGVQIMADGDPDPSKRPKDLQLTLIDPGASTPVVSSSAPASNEASNQASTEASNQASTEASNQASTQVTTAAVAVPKPTIHSRAEWGADESLRSGSPSYSSTLKAGIVHHTATGNDYSASDVPAIIRSSYAYHVKTLGWSDLGYNFMIDKFGTLWEGRYGGVDKPVIGAHTGGFNTYTFGASIIGNYDNVKPSSASVSKLEDLFAWKLAMYGRDPNGKVELTSGGGSYTTYPAGTKVDANVISGHRNYSTKSCPGDLLYPMLPTIRDAVAARMSKVATIVTARVSTTSVNYGDRLTVSGKLTTASGTPLAGKPVKLEGRAQVSDTWQDGGTTTTASDGTWKLTNGPHRSVEYRARFFGDSKYEADDSPLTYATVRPTVSATLSSSSIPVGSTVRLSGTVNPTHAGQTVQRQSYYNGAWHTVGTTTLSSTGSYSWTITPPANKGTHTLRVYKPADSDHGSAVSATRTLTVS